MTPEQWQYFGAKENPADLASRGDNLDKIHDHHLWWHVPEFLQLPKEHWPVKEQFLETEFVKSGYLFCSFCSDSDLDLDLDYDNAVAPL
jgi:hypothetical protein